MSHVEGIEADSEWVERVRIEAAKRPCGECQECCYVASNETFGKPPMRRCQHQCGAGCAIYADRPRECSEFFCMWKMGIDPSLERPDRSGVLIWSGSTPDGSHQTFRVDIDMDRVSPKSADSALAVCERTVDRGVPVFMRFRGFDSGPVFLPGRIITPWFEGLKPGVHLIALHGKLHREHQRRWSMSSAVLDRLMALAREVIP